MPVSIVHRACSVVFASGQGFFTRCGSNIWVLKRRTYSVLTSSEINSELRKDQHSALLKDSFLSRCDVSHLASNRPSEDRWFASRIVCSSTKDSFVVGVLDGHGGTMCSEVVSQRLAQYIAAYVLKDQVLTKNDQHHVRNLFEDSPKLVDTLKTNNDPLWSESFKKVLKERSIDNQCSGGQFMDNCTIITAIKQAFLRLDCDLHEEALRSIEDNNIINIVPYITAVQSGSCVLASYLTSNCVFVANTGDCRAVAGVQRKDGKIVAQPMSIDQTTGNPSEIARIVHEHPDGEAGSLFSQGRLLGILTPLRSFGDAWLKWKSDKIHECFKYLYGPEASQFIPLFYNTPPYLTAEPEVVCYSILESGAQFLILATDGLWDLISNDEAVNVVENYLKINKRDNINLPSSDNIGTALIRHALARENVDNLSIMLSHPFPDVRMYRDDITAMVLLFN